MKKVKEEGREMKNAKDDDEVEQLLQAAQDEILIKLSIDSHSSRSHTTNYLHPDLDSRFLALKSSPKPKSNDVEETPDDLLLRFSALKGSLPPSSSSVSIPDAIGEDDEVEKVIQWAIDAARLDPSPASDDEDSHNSDDDNDFSKDAKP